MSRNIQIREPGNNYEDVLHPETNSSMVLMENGSTLQEDLGDLTALQTTHKTSLVGAINEVFTNVSNGKDVIATAITDKGVPASGSDTFATLATKIGQINTEPFISEESGYLSGAPSTDTNVTHTFTHGLGKTPSVVLVMFSAVNTSYPDRLSKYSYTWLPPGLATEVKQFLPNGRTPETPDITGVTVNSSAVTVGVWHKGGGYGNWNYTVKCVAI